MSYYYNGSYNASNVNGGHPNMRGGQGNGIPAATHGHSVQHVQALHQHTYQQPPASQQRPQAPPQQAPPPRPTLLSARAPPPPPIHFVLDRQYTLCNTFLSPAPPDRSALQPPVPHYAPAQNGPLYTPARDGAHYTPTKNLPHHTPPRDGAHYTPTQNVSQHTPARYVPPALRNGPQYTPAPHTPYAPAPVPAPAVIPFRCSHPQCGGRVVMVPSAREHMWAVHRVRV